MRGLQPAEIAMLELLQEIGPAPSKEVREKYKEETQYSKSTASSCLSHLNKRGYLSRNYNINNPTEFVWEIENAEKIKEAI